MLLLGLSHAVFAAEISLTMDDFDTKNSVMMSPQVRNYRILSALKKHKIKAGLFVVARNVQIDFGQEMLRAWSKDGHLIGNHTFSHPNFHSKEVTFESFAKNFQMADEVLKTFDGFQRYFRFPMAHEGDTLEKRNKMRALLAEKGYKNAAVAIDASDWYIDERLKQRLQSDPHADIAPYREYYLDHMWKRAQFYRNLAKDALEHEVKMTIVTHFNLLNALFLEDLLTMFEKRRWKWISAQEAFQDPIYTAHPQTLPAGQSIIWALAKESGKFESILRYPGEDGEYEKPAMDRLGL